MSQIEAISTLSAMKQALEALENSVDLVVADAYNAEQLYGKYPSRQARVGGLKLLADTHQQAMLALRQAIAEAEQQEPKREWVGLTDVEIADCMTWSIKETCKAIEAKLKEKNT
jgi:hypothetical protein